MTDRVPGSAEPTAREAVIALDGLAYGIEQLDGVLVFRLSDGRLHAAWTPSGSGLRAEEIVGGLREAYRACLAASHSIAAPSSHANRLTEQGLFITIEMFSRTAMMKRSRGFCVACLFDASMPLGMARLVATRLAAMIEPDLPVLSVNVEVMAASVAPAAPAPEAEVPLPIAAPFATSPMASSLPSPMASSMTSPMASSMTSPMASSMTSPMASSLPPPLARLDEVRAGFQEVDRELPPRTLDFPSTGTAIVRRHSTPLGSVQPPGFDAERVRRVLGYLRENAPEPHIAHLRVALRAGLTPIALERLDALASSKMALIEAAASEILGIDVSELGRLS